MPTLSVNIPEAVLYDTRMSIEDTQVFVKRAAALLFYTSKGISLSYCAMIAETSKVDFIRFLAENGVSVFSDVPCELARDVTNA